MASVRDVKLSVTKSNDSQPIWLVNVSYTAKFNPPELTGFKFREKFILREDDSGEIFNGADDVIKTQWGKEFDPSKAEVQREISFKVPESDLDTEGGEERLYVQVRLYNTSFNIGPYKGHSQTLALDI